MKKGRICVGKQTLSCKTSANKGSIADKIWRTTRRQNEQFVKSLRYGADQRRANVISNTHV